MCLMNKYHVLNCLQIELKNSAIDSTGHIFVQICSPSQNSVVLLRSIENIEYSERIQIFEGYNQTFNHQKETSTELTLSYLTH